MKKYTIIFEDKELGHIAATVKSDKGLLHVIFKFQIDHVEYQESDIKSIEVEDIDTLVEFLGGNPPNDKEETPELTEKEQHLVWQADHEATQRQENELNTFHQ